MATQVGSGSVVVYGILSEQTTPAGYPLGSLFVDTDTGLEYSVNEAGNWFQRKQIGIDQEGKTTTNVVVSDSELDIITHDNLSTFVSVVAGLSLPSGVIPAGVKRVLVSYFNHNVGGSEFGWLRWNAAAALNTSMRIKDGDSFIMKVPDTGNRILYCMGQPACSVGTIVTITPLG